ncbi:MAG: leucine-rich repeat protein [Clostridia bacterium]|nr:leucine-rich repeat protein [Clostridia bacterium]
MKKTIIKLLVTLLCLSFATFFVSGCSQPHTHVYDQQIVESEYYAYGATCNQAEQYYYSCACGEAGEETFGFGEKLEHEFNSYTPDNNATYDSDGTKTSTCARGCGATKTITDDGTKLQSHVEFKTLNLNEKNVFTNSVEEFSFLDEIEVFGYSTFEVANNKYGANVFFTKTVPLSVGDNTFYVFESIDGSIVNTFTIVLRRRPVYEITFNTYGGSDIEKQDIEESFIATRPQTDPEKAGYTFEGWDYDFSLPVNNDVQVNAIWTANSNTPYTVEYYFENIENDNYTIDNSKTENKTGTTDTVAYAEIKTFDHFTPSSSAVSANINGNGETVLKVYYTRNEYRLSNENTSSGDITNSKWYKYGAKIQTVATPYLGYDFIGWYGAELLSTELNYEFTIDENVVAKFEVKEEMKIFEFRSTFTTCKITGLKDETITELIIPDCVTSIGSHAFSSLRLTSVEIPNSVTSIGYGAFMGCALLTSIEIPNSVTSIGGSVFSGCSSLKYNVKDGLKYLGNEDNEYLYLADTENYNITSAIIEDGCKFIGNHVFNSCSKLTSIKIPESVISIGESAFANCHSLTSIILPDSVTSIDSYAFLNCSSLEKIYCETENKPDGWDSSWKGDCLAQVVWGY